MTNTAVKKAITEPVSTQPWMPVVSEYKSIKMATVIDCFAIQLMRLGSPFLQRCYRSPSQCMVMPFQERIYKRGRTTGYMMTTFDVSESVVLIGRRDPRTSATRFVVQALFRSEGQPDFLTRPVATLEGDAREQINNAKQPIKTVLSQRKGGEDTEWYVGLRPIAPPAGIIIHETYEPNDIAPLRIYGASIPKFEFGVR